MGLVYGEYMMHKATDCVRCGCLWSDSRLAIGKAHRMEQVRRPAVEVFELRLRVTGKSYDKWGEGVKMSDARLAISIAVSPSSQNFGCKFGLSVFAKSSKDDICLIYYSYPLALAKRIFLWR